MNNQIQEPVIVDVALTTNYVDPCGEVRTLIVDADKQHLLGGQALCKNAPEGHLFIVRDHLGRELRRHEKESRGVSLASYLHGKRSMTRLEDIKTDDFSVNAFNLETGRYAQIDVFKSEHSHQPVETLFAEETANDYRNKAEAANMKRITSYVINETDCTLAKAVELTQEMVRHLKRYDKKIESNRSAPIGQSIKCPECNVSLVKQSARTVYCSSRKRPLGDKVCRDTLKVKIENLKASIQVVMFAIYKFHEFGPLLETLSYHGMPADKVARYLSSSKELLNKKIAELKAESLKRELEEEKELEVIVETNVDPKKKELLLDLQIDLAGHVFRHEEARDSGSKGDKSNCAHCGVAFIKPSYNSVFCSSKDHGNGNCQWEYHASLKKLKTRIASMEKELGLEPEAELYGILKRSDLIYRLSCHSQFENHGLLLREMSNSILTDTYNVFINDAYVDAELMLSDEARRLREDNVAELSKLYTNELVEALPNRILAILAEIHLEGISEEDWDDDEDDAAPSETLQSVFEDGEEDDEEDEDEDEDFVGLSEFDDEELDDLIAETKNKSGNEVAEFMLEEHTLALFAVELYNNPITGYALLKDLKLPIGLKLNRMQRFVPHALLNTLSDSDVHRIFNNSLAIFGSGYVWIDVAARVPVSAKNMVKFLNDRDLLQNDSNRSYFVVKCIYDCVKVYDSRVTACNTSASTVELSTLPEHKKPTAEEMLMPKEETAFKTINGIPFTVAQMKVLVSGQNQDPFMKIKGIEFSAQEVRQLIDME